MGEGRITCRKRRRVTGHFTALAFLVTPFSLWCPSATLDGTVPRGLTRCVDLFSWWRIEYEKRRALPGSCYLLERDTRHFRVSSASSIAQLLRGNCTATPDISEALVSPFLFSLLTIVDPLTALSALAILPANLSHVHFLHTYLSIFLSLSLFLLVT